MAEQEWKDTISNRCHPERVEGSLPRTERCLEKLGMTGLRRLLALLFSVLLAVVMVCAPANAQVRVKLGTLAPKDSSPHQSLKVMAEKWRQAPGGGVQLVVFTDGTQGGEADMVRRMRIGQLQAAMLTATGLAQIDDSVTALETMPLVYRTLDEVDYVREKLRPKLEQAFADKGFIVLFWTDGWVKFFSRRPVVSPDDLKSQKLFAWAGDNKSIDIIKAAGYQPIPLETTDILRDCKPA